MGNIFPWLSVQPGARASSATFLCARGAPHRALAVCSISRLLCRVPPEHRDKSPTHRPQPWGRALVSPAVTAIGCVHLSSFQLCSCSCATQPHSQLIKLLLFHTCFPVYSLATGTSSLRRSWSSSLAMLVSTSPSSRTISISRRKAPRVCTCKQGHEELH